MAQPFILSIDQGTTGTTASLINTKGQLKAKVNREFRQFFPQPGWVEHEPKDIWRSTTTVVKKVMGEAGVSSSEIASIGITNQRETVMAWNRESGEVVGRAIVWQCRRTAEVCQQLKNRGLEKRVKEITGLVLDPYFSGSKMQWILENNQEAKRLAKKGLLCFGTVDTFLMWKLSRGKTYATDVSNASRTLLMDLKTLDYSEEMLKLFSLNRSMLPEIRPSGGLFGKTAAVAGLTSGVPITGVLGDQQSALFGQQCYEVGDAKITFGTGSFLLMNTQNRKILSRNGMLTTVAWQLPGAKKADYALEGGAFICGAAVQWLRDELGLVEKSSDIEKLAKKVADTGGVEFVPSFVGLGAPYWDSKVRGTLFGLTRGTSREHIARATLEAMALQNVDVVETMIKDSRINLKKVKVDGGAAANNLLMQMQADFLGVSVVRPKVLETTSYGAGLMAGLGAGVWSSLAELKKLERVDREFTSEWRLKQRNQRKERWHGALKAMQSYYKTR